MGERGGGSAGFGEGRTTRDAVTACTTCTGRVAGKMASTLRGNNVKTDF
jgi:hypothetical protein